MFILPLSVLLVVAVLGYFISVVNAPRQEVGVYPSKLLVERGGTARFLCSTNTDVELVLSHRRVGESRFNILYTDATEIRKKYLETSRYSVVKNSFLGTWMLTITNVTDTDAGTFKCSIDSNYNISTFAELIVADSLPVCRSNVDLTNILIANLMDCNQPPGNVELTCQLWYHGNVPLVSEIIQQNDIGIRTVTKQTTTTTSYSEITVFLNVDHLTDGTVLKCSMKIANSTKKLERLFSAIKLSNFSDSAVIVRPTNREDYKCLANTNQTCRYTWFAYQAQKSARYTSQHLSFEEAENFHHLSCTVQCGIRNSSCKAYSTLVQTVTGELATSHSCYITVIVFLAILVVFLSLVIIIYVVFIQKKKTKRELTLMNYTDAPGNHSSNSLRSSYAERKPLLGHGLRNREAGQSQLLDTSLDATELSPALNDEVKKHEKDPSRPLDREQAQVFNAGENANGTYESVLVPDDDGQNPEEEPSRPLDREQEPIPVNASENANELSPALNDEVKKHEEDPSRPHDREQAQVFNAGENANESVLIPDDDGQNPEEEPSRPLDGEQAPIPVNARENANELSPALNDEVKKHEEDPSRPLDREQAQVFNAGENANGGDGIPLISYLEVLARVISWKTYALKFNSKRYAIFCKPFDDFVSFEQELKKVRRFSLKVARLLWNDRSRLKFEKKLFIRVIHLRRDSLNSSLDCQFLFLEHLHSTQVISDAEYEDIQRVQYEERDRKLMDHIIDKKFPGKKAFLEQVFLFRPHVFNQMFFKTAMPKFESEKFRQHVFDNRGVLMTMVLEGTRREETSSREIIFHLVDLLHKNGCVSNSQKRFIDQLTEQSKKEFVVDLLINGPCAVVETAARHFRDTRQVDLYRLLDRIYVNIDEKDFTHKREISLAFEATLVSWYGNRLYVLSNKSKVILVQDEDFQLVESETIEIGQLKKSYGMTNIGEPRSIVISDCEEKKLLHIMISDKSVLETSITGEPKGISTTPFDDVLVVVKKKQGHSLEKYKAPSSGLELTGTVNIPDEVESVWEAIQTTSDTLVIACTTGNDYFLQEISDFRCPSMKSLRKFSTFSSSIMCTPSQLSITENDGIVFIDSGPNSRVIYLSPLWLEDDLRVMISNKNPGIEDPVSLRYVRERNMLIVGRKSTICVYKC